MIIDTQKHGADFKFAKSRSIAFVTSLHEAAATMRAIYAEVQKRARLNAEYGVGSCRDLPSAVRPRTIVVFIDEFLGVIMAGKQPPRQPEDEPEREARRMAKWAEFNAKKDIAFLSGRIAAEARSGDVHLFLMTQKLIAAVLDDEVRDLKTNMARILLGKANSGERMSALRDPESAPDLGDEVPKGRCIWESTMEAPQLAQFWYAEQDTYSAELEKRVPELRADQFLDIAPFQETSAGGSLTADGTAPQDSGASSDPFADFEGEPDVEVLEEFEFELDLDDLNLDGRGENEHTQARALVTSDFEGDDEAVDTVRSQRLGTEPKRKDTAGIRASAAILDAPPIDLSAILLDVDGVVSPIGGNVDTWPDGDLIDSPFGAAWCSPEMLRAVHAIGVPVLWATDWKSNAEVVFAPIAGTRAAATLLPGSGDGGWWKLDAMSRLLDRYRGIRSIVWVDDLLDAEDDIGVRYSVIAHEIADHYGVRLKLIVPDSAVGLTPGDVDRIATFLGAPIQSSFAEEISAEEPERSHGTEPTPTEPPATDRATIVSLAGNPNVDDDDPFA
ncbi:hypothetical protein [Agromyces subbeticus]|uniref:hypothetical protein n=1 Tax=Agromyces subbeticus TaxID=293890 RepID=UPI0003B61E84|nr:hypothetical protein [Agromyces subbeticus]